MAYSNGGWVRSNIGDSGRAGTRTKNPNAAQVWEETITFTSATTDFYSSEIDFLPAGVDFTVWIEQPTTMSQGGDVITEGALAASGTFITMGTVVNNFAANAGGSSQFTAGVYNQDSAGDAPIYKLFCDMDGSHSGGQAAPTAKLYLVYSNKPAR